MTENIKELTILLQVMATEDKGEKTVLKNVYQPRNYRLDAQQLINKGEEWLAAGRSEDGFELAVEDLCKECKGQLRLIIDEQLSNDQDGIHLSFGNIYCDKCSPSMNSPTFAISAVYDDEGESVACECDQCPDCENPSVIWLDGVLFCWPCIKKHNLKSSVAYEDD